MKGNVLLLYFHDPQRHLLYKNVEAIRYMYIANFSSCRFIYLTKYSATICMTIYWMPTSADQHYADNTLWYVRYRLCTTPGWTEN